MARKISLTTVGRLKEFLKDVSDNTPILFTDEGAIESACSPWIFYVAETENAVVIRASF